MAKFNLTGSKTVGELKKEFNEAFGSRLKVYNKNKIAEDTTTLGELGLKADTEFECRSSRTAGSFIAAFAELGLKVKVYTSDEWVAVLPGLTLETTGKVKKNATKADMEGMEGYQKEEKTVNTSATTDNVDINATYSAIDFGEIRLDEDEVIGLYSDGKGENIRRAVNNLIYDLHNEICDFCVDEDLNIDLDERGAIYVDNLVENDDNEFGIQFQLPCKFVVVAGGKIVDTFTIEDEPTEIEGYLYTEIPYGYKLNEVEERLEEDSEWIENDMMRLINRTEQDEWMHSLEVGDLGNGLYVKDVDSYLYSVVVGGTVVYSLE